MAARSPDDSGDSAQEAACSIEIITPQALKDASTRGTSSSSKADSPTFREALAYAARGFRVVPVNWIDERGCSCRKPNCPAPGKHPMITEWPRKGTDDPRRIKNFWKRWNGKPNVGVLTGENHVVLDIDPRNGGDDELAALESLHGPLPHTPEVLTGGIGRHIYFQSPAGSIVRSRDLAPGVEVKAKGRLVVGAQSTHASGNTYTWDVVLHPDEIPFAELPAWIAGMQVAEDDDDRDEFNAVKDRQAAARPLTPDQAAEFRELFSRVGVNLDHGSGKYRCPFHDDLCPSLNVDVRTGWWWCFACSDGGSLQWLRFRVTSRVGECLDISNTNEDRHIQTPRWETEAQCGVVDICRNRKHREQIRIAHRPCKTMSCPNCHDREIERKVAGIIANAPDAQMRRVVLPEDARAWSALTRKMNRDGAYFYTVPGPNDTKVLFTTAEVGERLGDLTGALISDINSIPNNDQRRCSPSRWPENTPPKSSRAWERIGRTTHSMHQIKKTANEIGLLVVPQPHVWQQSHDETFDVDGSDESKFELLTRRLGVIPFAS
ncbi:MAG: bifunctional DNA primase/polymerase [Actinomycetota bacterium]